MLSPCRFTLQAAGSYHDWRVRTLLVYLGIYTRDGVCSSRNRADRCIVTIVGLESCCAHVFVMVSHCRWCLLLFGFSSCMLMQVVKFNVGVSRSQNRLRDCFFGYTRQVYRISALFSVLYGRLFHFVTCCCQIE